MTEYKSDERQKRLMGSWEAIIMEVLLVRSIIYAPPPNGPTNGTARDLTPPITGSTVDEPCKRIFISFIRFG
ncbi:hypothetical protein CHUAL_006080 [Chamberlinius hualienensis]